MATGQSTDGMRPGRTACSRPKVMAAQATRRQGGWPAARLDAGPAAAAPRRLPWLATILALTLALSLEPASARPLEATLEAAEPAELASSLECGEAPVMSQALYPVRQESGPVVVLEAKDVCYSDYMNDLRKQYAGMCPQVWTHNLSMEVKGVMLMRPPLRKWACFVALCSDGDGKPLINWMHKLQTFYLHRYPYSIVIFHQPDAVSKAVRRELQWSIRLTAELIFVELNDYGVPEAFQDRSRFNGRGCDNKVWSHGYLAMNHFFVYQMYKYFDEDPRLSGFKFYFRIDLDAEYIAPVPFDVFEYMRAAKLDFVTHNIADDEPAGCLAGMKERMGEFLGSDARYRKMNASVTPRTTFVGNYGAGRLAFFRCPEVLRAAKYFTEESPGFYLNRWSDQGFYAIALSAFNGRVGRLGTFDGFCNTHKHQRELVGAKKGSKKYVYSPDYIVNRIDN